jgi:hypothetical protein
MFSIFLASILLAGTPLLVENVQSEAVTSAQIGTNSYEMGSFIVEKTRADYQNGKYSEFLKKMDRDYKEAKESNGLEGLIELRQETAKVNIHPEFIRSYDIIQASKNEHLLEVVGSDDSSFAKKVRSAARSIAADSPLLRSLHFKVPSAPDVNEDERAVIDIDLEYYYKSIHLDSLSASSKSIVDRREKQIALEMEKMDRLLQAASSFEDRELEQAIENSALHLDARLAKNYDMRDLLALARGNIKSTSSLEEKVASIVGNAQGQIAELHRQLLNTLDNAEPIAETVQ